MTSILRSRPHGSPLKENAGSPSLADELALEASLVPDELIICLDRNSNSEKLLHQSLPGKVVERFDLGTSPSSSEGQKEILRIKLPSGSDVRESLQELESLDGVSYAEPNYIYHLSDEAKGKSPDDLNPGLWGLYNEKNPNADIDAPQAWAIATGSREGPLIAVLDSGADYRHNDLTANIARNEADLPGDGVDNDDNGIVDDHWGYNAFEGTGDPMDGMGHGTHCTGTIAAVGDNGQGVVGVNWRARVLPIKIFHDRGITTTDAIIRGLQYARQRGAKITSNSWGGSQFSQAIKDAFESVDALHIAASGNESQDTDTQASYPANFDLPNILSVGASNRDDKVADFSNTGRKTVDLFAPGEDILSTLPGGEIGIKSGTSMATPHVTGVAGLVATQYPQASVSEIRDRLVYSTDPGVAFETTSVSGGRLNAHQALSDDTTPPAVPNDFVLTQASPTSLRFSWTVSGDDAWKNGPATAFEVRYSMDEMSEGSWGRALPLSTPRAQEIGQHLHARLTLNPSSEERTVYAGFKAIDEAANRSPLATLRATVPAAAVTYSQNFDDPNSMDWQGSGRFELVEQPHRGKVWSSKFGSSKDTFSVLSSATIDLSESRDSFLKFDSRQDFRWSNNVFFELKEEGEDRWQRIDVLEDRGTWKTHEYDLSSFDGKKVQLRFRSENLGSKDGDGMMLDRVEILQANRTRSESTF